MTIKYKTTIHSTQMYRLVLLQAVKFFYLFKPMKASMDELILLKWIIQGSIGYPQACPDCVSVFRIGSTGI